MPHLVAKKGKRKQRAEQANPLSHVDKSTPYMPGENERKLLDELKKMFRDAVRMKSTIQEHMKRAEEVYESGILDEEIPEIKGIKQEVDTNFAKSLIKSVQGKITDANPRPVAAKRNPDDVHFAEITDNTLQWVLDVNNWKQIRDKAVKDCTDKGVAFVKAGWDGSKADGEGNISLRYIDPLAFFPGSLTSEIDEMDRMFILHSDPVSKVIDRFKELNKAVDEETGSIVVADKDLEEKIADSAGGKPFTQLSASGFENLMGPLSSRQSVVHKLKDLREAKRLADSSATQISPDDNVNYVEAFLRYPDGHPLKEEYPKGRLVYFTDRGIIGDFGWQKDCWPVAKFQLEPSGDYFWNEPVILPVASLQQSINALSSLIMKASTVHAFPPVLTPFDSGLKRDEFENVGPANRILHVNQNAVAQTGWMKPPPIPQAAFQLRQEFIQEMEQILGVHDITQGRTPGSIQSGTALARLQEADMTTIRQKRREFNKGLKKLGKIIIEHIQDHFTSKRMISVGDGPEEQFLRLNDRADVQQAQQMLQDQVADNDQRAREIIARARQKQIANERIREGTKQVIINDPTIANVDIRIGGGKDTKISQAAKAADALRLAEMGMLDARGVLEALDWEDRDRIIRKLDREKVLAQQVQGLQKRIERTEKALRQIVGTADTEQRARIRQALNNLVVNRATNSN